MKREFLLLSVLLTAFSWQSFGQKKSIVGTIASRENGNPIGGIIVVVKGTHQGLVTADDGYFDLIVSEGDTIALSSRYFTDRDVLIGADSKYDIQLDLKNNEKSTGYLFPGMDEKKNVLTQITAASTKK